MWEGSSDEWNTNTGVTIPTGEWSLCALTITPTIGTVYRITNRSVIAGKWSLTKSYSPKTLKSPLFIGVDDYDTMYVFYGDFAEARVYNRAFSETELLATAADPWSLYYRPQRVYFDIGSSPVTEYAPLFFRRPMRHLRMR